jgi:phosphoglycerol transferase MdoB-like AlkP superfamily enzyme
MRLTDKKKKAIIIAMQALLLLAAAAALNLWLQYRTEDMAFVRNYTALFAYGSMAVFFFLSSVTIASGSAAVAIAAVFDVFTLIAFGDVCKYAEQQEHVYPSDVVQLFTTTGFVSMYDRKELAKVIALCAAVTAAAVVLTVMKRRRRGRLSQLTLRRRLVFTALPLLLACAALAPAAGIVYLEPAGFHYVSWNQQFNYERNGFLMAFASNLRGVSMEKPEGYGKAAVDEVVRKYAEVASRENASRTDLASADIDIVYVLNESFSNPDRFTDVYPYTGDDLVKNYHRYAQQSVRGTLSSPVFGGGTANVEFEALTGLSCYPLGAAAVPFQQEVATDETFPSVARYLEGCGYRTTGMHAYIGSMYRRNMVYPALGFDEFVDEKDFTYTETDRDTLYISDKSSYKEALMRLDDSEQKNFLMLVTMQNHGRFGGQYLVHHYDTELYLSWERERALEDYLELLHSSDEGLATLMEGVSMRERKTVVVFWGDHLPSVFGQLRAMGDHRAYETPLLIYANFDLPGGEDGLGEISPNYISDALLDVLGARKPPFYYLLGEMRERYPEYTGVHYDGKDPEPSQALDDYLMIEYDVIKGEGYSLRGGFFDEAGAG